MLFAAVLAPMANLDAQNPISQNVDRAQLLRNSQLGLREPESSVAAEEEQIAASPNDPDLGEQAILKRSSRYQPWTFFAAIPISYTSNVALSSMNEQGDVLFTPSVGISFSPKLTRTLFANISVSQQFFYYDRFDDLDFGSFDFRAGLNYSIPQWRNLIVRADYAFNRLTSGDGLDDEFYTSHSLNFGAEMPFRLGRAQQLSVGVDLSFNLDSDPEGPGRHEYGAFAAYSLALTRSFSLGAGLRLAVRDYVEGDRTDLSASFALNASYRITRWLSANASASFASNESNQEGFDYDVANLGGAFSLTLRF